MLVKVAPCHLYNLLKDKVVDFLRPMTTFNPHYQQNALADIDVLLTSSPRMRVQLVTWSVGSHDQVPIWHPGFRGNDGLLATVFDEAMAL